MSQALKHLYWRAGFGLSPMEWQSLRNEQPQSLVAQLLEDAAKAQNRDIGVEGTRDSYFRHKRLRRELMEQGNMDAVKQNREQLLAVKNNWVERMASPKESALLERMCLFWHGHFACIADQAHIAQLQLDTIRKHALGNFKELTQAIAKDGGMIFFLNTDSNRKGHPNENFARELLELFTIGIGNYSEADIQEAARAFTGWNLDEDGLYIFRKKQHDEGIKHFMGKSGNFNGNDIIDIIFQNKQTAYFIANKVYRYFVNEQLDAEKAKELGDVFYKSNYDISKMMRHLFESEWFYAPQHIGTKIKSPMDLIAGMMRTIPVKYGTSSNLIFVERLLGQELFQPPNVKGWEGGKYWINNSTLLFRLKFVNYLTNKIPFSLNVKEKPEEMMTFEKEKNRFRKATVDFSELTSVFMEMPDIESTLTEYLLQTNSSLNDQLVQRSSVSKREKIQQIAKDLIGSAEYQLC